MKYFIANWKANKNLNQANEWLDKFLSFPLTDDKIKVIICPPSPLIYPLKERLKNSKNISLGIQDISIFEEGTYTGEVTAKTLANLVNYTIVGHSERMQNFSETSETNDKKVELALKYNIDPLLCIQNENVTIPSQVKYIVYEPPWAISKGLKDSLNTRIEETPDRVIEVRKKLNINADRYFIYGGSVNPGNIKEYAKYQEIDGVLVGGASLDPVEFHKIIISA